MSLFTAARDNIELTKGHSDGCLCYYCEWLRRAACRVESVYPHWDLVGAVRVVMARFWDANDQSGDVAYDHDPVMYESTEDREVELYEQWKKRGV